MANKNITKKALAEKEVQIQKNMKILGISREEANELYAYDNDEIDCDEVVELENKIKEKQQLVVAKKGSPLDKVKHMKAKKKADIEKTAVIDAVFNFIIEEEFGVIVNPQPISTTKMSFKGAEGGYYSVTITKHKSIPDGYRDEKEV